MGRRPSNSYNRESSLGRPSARTDEGREKQVIALAIDLAEEQIRNGTASSQVITHFLRLGSSKEKLEKEKLMRENEVLKARYEAITKSLADNEFYQSVIDAMKGYRKGMPDD